MSSSSEDEVVFFSSHALESSLILANISKAVTGAGALRICGVERQGSVDAQKTNIVPGKRLRFVNTREEHPQHGSPSMGFEKEPRGPLNVWAFHVCSHSTSRPCSMCYS